MDPNEPLSGGSDASETIVSASDSSSDSSEKKLFRCGLCRATSLDAVMSCHAPGCEADGAWHDITASREVARHSPQRKSFFSDTDEDDSDAETIVSEASLPQDRGSFGSMASLASAPV